MKKVTKILIFALCAVLLVAGSVMGTLAWLTSQGTVTNTFTVGKVSITLDETNVDGKDAAGLDNSSVARDIANKYALVPGKTYTKDPVIHVSTESEDCYLFVKVENGISALEVEAGTGKTIAEQLAANGWTLLAGTTDIYVYNVKVEKTATERNITVFKEFSIKKDVKSFTEEDAQAKIIVTAYAVQADGFNSAAEAWDAAKGQFTNS